MPEAGWVNKSELEIQPLAWPVVLSVITESLHYLFLVVAELGCGNVVRFSRWASKILPSTTIVIG
jgi:hypothetical protein